MQLRQEQKASQQLRPQMLTAMQILQMDTLQLHGYLSSLLLENPTLESKAPAEKPRENRLRAGEELSGDTAYGSWQTQEQNPYENAPDKNRPAYGEDLVSHLTFQLEKRCVDAELRRWAVYVVYNLDETGYLRTAPEELTDEKNMPLLRRAVQLVQQLEPAGVGARDLSECLCLQLTALGETGLPYTIAQNHLREMGKHLYGAIARQQNVSEAEVRAACARIRSLSPTPCSAFCRDTASAYITPDILVSDVSGNLTAEINHAHLPVLAVSAFYSRMEKETEDRAVRQYLTQKISQARWILQCLSQREDTILRCANEILVRQADFFAGSAPLQPMTMNDIACAIGVHVSTVSRALSGKYMQTPYGTWKAGDLFTAALGKTKDVSADRARKAIRALIEQENPKSPLSDQRLSQLLTDRGIPISRRTVAKYRDALQIPTAALRKI